MHILVGPLQCHVTQVTCIGPEHAYLVGFATQGHVAKMTFIMQQVNAPWKCHQDANQISTLTRPKIKVSEQL